MKLIKITLKTVSAKSFGLASIWIGCTEVRQVKLPSDLKIDTLLKIISLGKPECNALLYPIYQT